MRRPGLALFAVLCAGLSSCRKEVQPQHPGKNAEPPSVVRLSPDAVRTAGIETVVVGGALGKEVLTLTGTLAAKPWTPEEQTALSDAATADAKLRLAEANLNRLSRLSRDGVVARQDLDAARAARDEARAAAAQADSIRANLGLSSTALEREAKIWGLASLSDVDLAAIRPGEDVDVTTPAFPGRHFHGRVVAVSRSADPSTRNVTVRIAVDDPEGLLRPQMLASFAISTPAPAGLAIPKSAILLEGDGSYVYVASSDHEFRPQRIETQDSSSDTVTVTAGLSSGQRVVVRGAQLLESERLKSRIRPAEAD